MGPFRSSYAGIFRKRSMLINRLFVLGLLGLAGAGLTACGGNDYGIGSGNPQVAAMPDKVSLMLADAADRSSTALQTLASIEQHRTPHVAMAPIENAPPALMRAMTLNWTGPVEPVLKTLADRAGYGFQVLGSAPPVPVVVAVNAENKPVVEIMRSIGLQLGARANVRVDGATQMVEIHYVSKSAGR